MMVFLMWGGIAATAGLLVLLGESLIGLHANDVSHANVFLWLIITPIVAVGSMVHKRMKAIDSFGYGAALSTGLITSATATAGLLLIWLLFVGVLYPEYFGLMHRYATNQALAQGHTGLQLAQEIHSAKLIFVSPSFYLISAIIPLLVGTIASFIGAIGVRKRV
ncbi:MAG: DUF4199 family protein [Ignavibacteria bacterium]|nr:DUF4199 family protein [Ignavibacteria bacterium]MBK7412896.1 DUF4199 family protein [Ignavibacteria bacterium]MBL0321609.1 DUF4199 family protein [Ignavibacteria bacterium]MBP7092869.1 DUF4199 family protein [Candidatus Kapabacteria bacterium]